MLAASRYVYSSIWSFIIRVVDLIGLFMAMYLSELLLHNAVFGGAVYICCQVWVIYARLYNKKTMHLLPASTKGRGLFIFIIAILLTTALVLLYPYILSKTTSFLLLPLIVGFVSQQIVTDTAAAKVRRRRVPVLAGLHLAFLAGYLALYFLADWLFAVPESKGLWALYGVACALSAVLLVCQWAQGPLTERDETETAAIEADRLLDVHAYRVYNNMAVNAFVAVNLSITAFICYMRFLPYGGFVGSVLQLCVWLAFISVVVVFFLWVLKKRYLERYDRPAIIMAGLVFWALGAYWMFRYGGSATWMNLLAAAMLGLSMACMLSIILLQGYEMQTVIALGVGHIDNGAYERNTSVMIDWSMLTAYLLLLVMLTVISFTMDGRFEQIEAMQSLAEIIKVVMLILPMFFVVASVAFSLLQPLDKHYAQKLRKYSLQRQGGVPNPVLEKRLKSTLVQNYPRKLAVRVLRPLVRPFIPCRVSGKEKVDVSQGPVIFVCNHLEVYGPVAAVLHSPFFFRPWVIQEMLDRDVVVAQMRAGVEKTFGWMPKGLREKLMQWAAPLVLWIMQSTDPIPVYRGTVRGVIQTIQMSVEAMEYDDNILLFPEINYQAEGVGDFFTGFVQVARTYHKETGKCAVFYPMYIDKKSRCITYGEGIRYNPENPSGEEKERIVDYLKANMNQIAGVQAKER